MHSASFEKTKVFSSIDRTIVYFYKNYATTFYDINLSERGNFSTDYYFEGQYMTQEGRALELLAYKYEILERKPILNILFGTELFNSSGKFFLNSFKSRQMFGGGNIDRQLHSDYAILLYGNGVIGLLFYTMLLLVINIKTIKYYRAEKKHSQNIIIERIIFSIFVSIFVTLLLNGFSDGILTYGNRIFAFMLLGTIFGYFTKKMIHSSNFNLSAVKF